MDTRPKDIAFKNASNNRDHNIFVEEYFGGSDVYIYIGGKLYDNISAIQFTLREQQKPIYGYGSRVYDDIATGTRIVQGVLRVPVKNEGPTDVISNQEATVAAASRNLPTYNAPDWLYKYKPEIEEQMTIQTEADVPNEKMSRVAHIQDLLRKNKYDIDINGVIDNKTRLAILEYKRNSSLVVNSDLDFELENRLDVHNDKNVYKTLGTVPLRYEPNDKSEAHITLNPLTRILIQGEYDDTWQLVQVENGNKGYIKKREMMKSAD